MTDLSDICLALACGLLLGGYYFGGLWWTVRRLPGRAKPGRFLAASFCVRLAPVLAGFGLVLQRGAVPFTLAFGGFLAVRIGLTRRVGRG